MYVMNEKYDSHSKLSLFVNWICDQITCQNILDTQYDINEIWSEIKKVFDKLAMVVSSSAKYIIPWINVCSYCYMNETSNSNFDEMTIKLLKPQIK